ncbi:MAG: CHAT domain-containing protein, partial [Hassallia sp.]
IQQQLDKDTVLLQYSLGKDRSYLWAVTPDSLDSYELPGQKQIEDAANNFREVIVLGRKLINRNNPNAINKPASQLTKIILAPVANKLGKKRLVIVADGVLQNIPFAALADPSATPTTTSVAYQPLLVNHQIVNLPSVTAIATQRQQLNKRKPAPKTLAILADPVFAADDKRVTGKEPAIADNLNLDRSSLQRALRNLNRNGLIPPLPGTRTEAEEILKLVSPSQSIHAYDFDANYNFATSPELKQYRFLQFATHGIVDTTNPELSGIVLSQIDKQGKPVEKGYLRLGDIFNLDLGAELVVLSACETGLGKNVKGEGLMGLTRGLMYAGSKRAVVSLWQVDDEGTSQLMPLFYKAILGGESPTSALRDAQLQLWQQKQWQNPYYWAAFTLQGDWR